MGCMKHRRALFALIAMISLASSSGLAQNDKKMSDQQKKEIQNIVKIVDDLAAGQNAPNDLSLAWVREDFLKAQGNKQYVPFTVSIDASKLAPNATAVALYWRVVAKDGAPEPAATTGQKKDDKKDKDKKKDYAYEDITFVPITVQTPPQATTTATTTTTGKTTTTTATTTITPGGTASAAGTNGVMRVARSFTVPAGTYDVYLVAKEPTPEKPPKNAPPPKTSAIKQTVTVPDFWNGELATSTVIVAQRIDPLPAPLTPQQQADRPYALGTMEIAPVYDLKFKKMSELSTFMLIYNPKTDSANKPDVVVEYNFYQKPAGQPEKFFNKTNPQNLNAQTLPPQFDLAAGHQLQSGQAVPLASFPEGDYRLEIKVTDKIANKTLTRDVNFSVNPS
ncbi:MAG: hypothetical protein DMG02_03290 [Acidobacteria bacterium]|nr:MAG: hypothetical protein DMG02_03290 [Acidobacteriota bacterium]PYR09591.1 MAG: hypothetical protein DMF99_14955 [Acidobacteriota bacterium]